MTDWLRPGTRLKMTRSSRFLVWTVTLKAGGSVWLMTPFASTPMELVPIQEVQGWLRDGLMEVMGRGQA